ncbi:MAG TPA: hypothetical protein VFQ74_07805 [Pseudolysinimonas sp.]|nr:hypothetical protein [Pseudolysinimonas sp.]
MAVRSLDYSALTDPVARADIVAWRAQARAAGQPWARSTLSIGSVITLGFCALLFVFVFGGAFSSFITDGIQNGKPIGVLFASLFVLVIAAGAIWAVRASGGRGGRWERWYRLSRFAAANGMRFQPMDVPPAYPGQIFQIGRNQVVVEHLVTGGRFLDIGNFRYITGSGKSQTTHNWGFVALALDRAMPNIVLDAKANNSFFSSNLPVALDRKQILHLEGDFDQHFTLYCPAEYEQDALYIFTPDLMALLVDEASPFDVELIDQWMFVYSSRPFQLTDPAVLQRLFTIADTVGAKALDQTEHYADDRIGDPSVNIVAPQGARLRRGVSVAGVAIIVVFVAFWGWNVFGSFFATP